MFKKNNFNLLHVSRVSSKNKNKKALILCEVVIYFKGSHPPLNFSCFLF